MKNRKGFTLIELLAVIVILAIIAVIAVPKILNMIEDVRKSSVKNSAYGYVKSIENKIAQSSLKGITYEDKEDYAYEDIQVDMKGTKPTYVRYSLKKGIVESGVFCIDDYIVNYTNKEVTVGEKCNEDELKLPGNVEISVSSENYTYPNSGKFKVTTNISGGTLSCTTSDKEVATCSISKDEVTVTPGTKEGKADITIKSAATSKHKEAQAVHVAITAKGTIPSVTATGYEGIYDGEEHGITVSATLDGATIKYGESNETYDKDVSPTYKDVGTYTVYYQITKEGYTTITGNKTVTIEKAEGNVTAPSAKTLIYTGSAQSLINAGSSSTGTIQYKLNDGTYSTNLPSATNAGTYTVYYKVIGDKNHNNVEEKFINVTIAKATISYTKAGYTGIYDGEEHGITVSTTLSGATIKYGTSEGTYDKTTNPTYTDVGTYTVYYQITKEGYVTVSGSETVEITKANNTLTLSANSATYTYPDSGIFEIIENLSGGTLSCKTSDSSIATCEISGTTITVKPGTTSGSATITVTSAATTNYNSVSAAHEAVTAKGTLSVTATGYEGEQDGTSHGITVTSSGATIKYGTTSGTYNLTSSPTYKDVGTYTVYYQVSKAGYETVTGSKQVIINPETITAPTRSSTTSNSTSITAIYNTGSATSGISSTNCYRTNSSGTVQANGTLSGNNCVFSGLSSNTTYYYKKCITSKAGNTSCSGVSNILTAGKVTNYAYTGGLQTYTSTCNGTLKLETWGAQGGSIDTSYIGGYGGYSIGQYNVLNNKTLYVIVGGVGSYNQSPNVDISIYNGGYNGGGAGTHGGDINAATYGFIAGGGSGGGATHIATSSGLLSTLSNSLDSILIVSGGGGGASYNSYSLYGARSGGSGGGIIGNAGTRIYDDNKIPGGTQSTGAFFGKGSGEASWSTAGTGGGYYGGTVAHASSGSGGSGYIGNNLLTNKSMYCYNCTQSSDTNTKTISTTNVSSTPTANYAKQGAGYARITILSCTN